MEHEITRHSLVGESELLIINVPNSISFYFGSYMRNGHRFCDPAKYEVPHLLEHIAFEGSKTYPNPLQFKSAIEKLGSQYNASTGNDKTYYYFVAGPEHLADIIDIGIDQIFEPLIQAKRVEQQKKVITQELIRSIDDDKKNNSYRHLHQLFPSLCPPFEERVKILQSITPHDVRQYHSSTYGVGNTYYILSGTFSDSLVKQVIAQLNNRLKEYPTGETKKFTIMPMKNLASIVTYDSKIPTQDHFCLSFNRPGADRDVIPSLKILNAIFGVGLGSRMLIKAREAGLTYGFSTGIIMSNDRTSFKMFDQTSPDKIMPLICMALGELRTISNDGFSEYEYERAKGLVVGSLKRSLQTPAALAGWYESAVLYGWPLVSPQERLNEYDKVSRQSIKEAADKYITKNNWLLTLIGQGLEEKKQEYHDIIDSHFE